MRMSDLLEKCLRLAGERDSLIEDSGKIAEELLKWKSEKRHLVSLHLLSTRYCFSSGTTAQIVLYSADVRRIRCHSRGCDIFVHL